MTESGSAISNHLLRACETAVVSGKNNQLYRYDDEITNMCNLEACKNTNKCDNDDSSIDLDLDDDDDEMGMNAQFTGTHLTGKKAFLSGAYHSRKELKVTNRIAFLSKRSADGKDSVAFKNKQRVMLLASRGITLRYRHLMKDLESLLPHCRKDAKFDAKGKLYLLNELADLSNCNNCLYFDVRKKTDLYWWMSKTPHGPSAKFLVQNVHTMHELKLLGNCLKGSRPILSFDEEFELGPQYALLKELFIHIFGTPKLHRKSKPFFDHCFSFSILDERIWFRHYQIILDKEKFLAEPKLIEIGPRFSLNLIRLFDGSFGGPTLYENPNYVSPNATRSARSALFGDRYARHVAARQDKRVRSDLNMITATDMDKVDSVFRE